MRSGPSANLVSLLARLKLATAQQVAGVASRVQRLAGDLPDFESVWVDALAQSRILTPLQAAEINAGRGDSLLHGPYVVSRALAAPHYAECFEARHIDTLRGVRLYVVRRAQAPTAVAAGGLAQWVGSLAPLRGPASAVAEDAGTRGEGVWAACPAVDGVTAAEWMVENGRFPSPAVLHIAREMVLRLADLERLGVVHGDLGAAGLLVQNSGRVVLPMPGLRGIVRPAEGYSFQDLQPDAYDYLAPERIAEGSPPTAASDLYACGCLWWHLLTGRPPFAGGNSLAKLRAVHAARILDVRQLAPEVPEVLARAIQMCLARDPAARPQSALLLSNLLGAPTRAGGNALAGCLNRKTQFWHGAHRFTSRRRTRRKRLPIAAALATVSIAIVVALWPLMRRVSAPTRMQAAGEAAGPKLLADAKPFRQASTDHQVEQRENEMRVDPAVTQAAASTPATAAVDDLILPADKVLRASELDLKPGRHVRGRAGQRPLVRVSGDGLLVASEEVRFDGIDFIWEAQSEVARKGARSMVLVEAQAIEFRGCSFSTTDDHPPSAIAWGGGRDDGLASGELVFSDCVFSGLAAVVDCQADAGLSVELNNVLCVASGPVVRLHRPPKREQSITIALEHATTRGDSAVLECRFQRVVDENGPITITATDSALAGNPNGGLLIFSGPERPDRLLRTTTWTGQGSLVTGHTAVAVWRNGRKQQTLAEDDLEVGGLVRSQVEFAGGAEGPPSASRVTRWQVPLRSAEPPGANPNSLFLPK